MSRNLYIIAPTGDTNVPPFKFGYHKGTYAALRHRYITGNPQHRIFLFVSSPYAIQIEKELKLTLKQFRVPTDDLEQLSEHYDLSYDYLREIVLSAIDAYSAKQPRAALETVAKPRAPAPAELSPTGRAAVNVRPTERKQINISELTDAAVVTVFRQEALLSVPDKKLSYTALADFFRYWLHQRDPARRIKKQTICAELEKLADIVQCGRSKYFVGVAIDRERSGVYHHIPRQ